MKRRYFVFGIVVSALVSLSVITGCGNPTGGGGGGGGGSQSGPTFYNNTIWVSPEGSDSGTGTDEANAFQTIGHALSVATAETLIRVMDGVYNEQLVWPATNTVCLSGESMSGTIISGESGDRCIIIDSTAATYQTITMESLTIAYGNPSADDGGGIKIEQSNIVLYLRRVAMTYNSVDTANHKGGAIYGDDTTDSVAAVNCVFSSNEAYQGGAIYLDVSGASDTNFLSAKNCSFFSNSAAIKGGAIFAPYVSLEASDFHDNSASYASPYNGNSGAAYINDGGLIVNCVFYNNIVTGSGTNYNNGGAISFDNNATLNVVNCTIVSNEVTGSTKGFGGGIGLPSAAIPLMKVKNCIIWGNLAAVSPEVACYSTVPTTITTCEVVYSDIGEGYIGTGNVTSDPVFVGETSLPYSSAEAFKLTAASPSKVKTGGAFIGAPTTDYLGHDRSRPYSMGAFEY
jgi:predicted outer membrane repeat protein